MFDSQFCSIVTITFIVQMFGLVTMIAYRVRGDGRFNQLGMVLGILVMGFSTIVCLPFDAGAGITQAVVMVLVAIGGTMSLQETEQHV